MIGKNGKSQNHVEFSETCKKHLLSNFLAHTSISSVNLYFSSLVWCILRIKFVNFEFVLILLCELELNKIRKFSQYFISPEISS